MKISGYIISLFIMGQVMSVSAQTEQRERDWKPSLLFLSADIVGVGRMISSGDNYAEFSAKMDFDQLFLAVDFGVENRNLVGDGFDYSSEGRFIRVGPQIDFMPYNKDRSNLFFGLMFGSATLSDNINYTSTVPDWPASQQQFSNVNLQAHWFEANLGLSARIVGPLFLGYTVRFKLGKFMDTPSELTPYSVPGFGPADKGSNFGFNYYITYKFGFRKKEIPERAKPKKRLEKVPVNEESSDK